MILFLIHFIQYHIINSLYDLYLIPYGVGLEKHVDLPCAPPNGAELVCTTYIDGTSTGKKILDEEVCSEVQIEAEITSEASAGIGNLGVKIGSKIGETRKVERLVSR